MKKEIKKPVKSFEPTAGWRLTMKDIPEKDRPYEKCEREGVGALTDAELLAILIRTGNRQESALSLATRILAQAQPPGILGLLHLTLPELMEQKGIGRVKGIELLCVGELSQRIWRTLTLSEAPVSENSPPESGRRRHRRRPSSLTHRRKWRLFIWRKCVTKSRKRCT